MKDFLTLLGAKLGKTFTEDAAKAADEIHGIIAAKDAEIEARTTEIQALTADRDGLKALAEDGKAYRKALLDDTVRFGALLGEVPADEADQKKQADFMATWPVEQIKAIRDRYEKRARESFPDTFTIKAKDDADRRKFTDPASEMEARVQEKMAAAKMGYSEAFAAVQREHPDLARRYAESIRK